MATHDQQQQKVITPGQNDWLRFAKDPDECMTTVGALTKVLKMAAGYKGIKKEERAAVAWVFYLLETMEVSQEEYMHEVIFKK